MSEKIGLIQTRGIGDIIIALPIADYFLAKGNEVYWPIDAHFVPMFTAAKPGVHFLPVTSVPQSPAYMYDEPVAAIERAGCRKRYMLYSRLGDLPVTDQRLARALKFDEYKYAITGVPFDRKWSFNILRNADRERALHARLGITREYICVHTAGSNMQANVDLPQAWRDQYQIVEVQPLTDNLFDWIYTLEHASKLVLIDSSFANLVEQLNIQVEKYFLVRSEALYTPVMKNGWRFT